MGVSVTISLIAGVMTFAGDSNKRCVQQPGCLFDRRGPVARGRSAEGVSVHIVQSLFGEDRLTCQSRPVFA